MLTITQRPVGVGIRDGRGYGPYGMGYYFDPATKKYLPYGPSGERLGPDYDFQARPGGGTTWGAPLKMVAPDFI